MRTDLAVANGLANLGDIIMIKKKKINKVRNILKDKCCHTRLNDMCPIGKCSECSIGFDFQTLDIIEPHHNFQEYFSPGKMTPEETIEKLFIKYNKLN